MLKTNAQEMAVKTSKIIGQDVIITDEESIIIGSSDKSRLNSLHEASINVLKMGKSNPEPININLYEGTKDGFVLPLEFFGKNLGSIGITGERNKVKGYCYLLKEYMETMLYQEMYFKTETFKEQAIVELFRKIAVFDSYTQDESYIYKAWKELGYDLEFSRSVLVIDFYKYKEESKKMLVLNTEQESIQLKKQHLKRHLEKIIKSVFKDDNDIIISFKEERIIVLPNNSSLKTESEITKSIKNDCNKLIFEFDRFGWSVAIGVGPVTQGVGGLHNSYKSARKALDLSGKQKKSELYYINDYILEDLSSAAINSISYKSIKKILDLLKQENNSEELMNTICAWCEMGFNKKQTANMLFIHRNTLQYRLKKIYKITNINPTNFKKIIGIYLVILTIETNEDNS